MADAGIITIKLDELDKFQELIDLVDKYKTQVDGKAKIIDCLEQEIIDLQRTNDDLQGHCDLVEAENDALKADMREKSLAVWRMEKQLAKYSDLVGHLSRELKKAKARIKACGS